MDSTTMKIDQNNSSSVSMRDEIVSLMNENRSLMKLKQENSVIQNISSDILTRKLITQNRLMRWCAILLSLGTLVIVWRYLPILILATWLSSICRPILEWLVNHL